MAISGPVLSTREDVKQALDSKETARDDAKVDAALEDARASVESLCNRRFTPLTATRVFDWPNGQRGYPWRLWLNQHEVISVSQLSSGGVVIPANQYFLEPVNSGPPYSRIELDRSTAASFTSAATPQHAISVTGVFGYGADTSPAGTLAAAVATTAVTTVTVSDSSATGVGSLLLIESERLLVTNRAMVTTGQSQQGSGVSTAVASDVALTVTDGTKYTVGETLLLDSERMLIVDIAANVLTVKRAWDGSALATHSGATVYAPRLCTVVRGVLGTAAATHLISTAIAVHVVPGLVRELAVAEAENILLQKSAGYARTVGEGDSLRPAGGAGLRDLRAQCVAAFGRQVRRRVI